MYVCICNAVTESQIRHAAANGASTMRELRQTLGVAAECGRCAGCAMTVLKEAHACSGNCAGCPSHGHPHS